MASVFLSYASTDRATALAVADALRYRELDVWQEVEPEGPASEWREEARDAMARADAVLVLATPASVSTQRFPRHWPEPFGGSERVVLVLAGGARSAALAEPLPAARSVDLDQDPAGIEKLVKAVTAGSDQKRCADKGGDEEDDDDAEDDDDNLVFVVIPFSPDMEPVFQAIQEAASSAGLRAERVKDNVGDYKIGERIVQQIDRARLVVADLTHERPNVYFELGYARGLGKTVVTIARAGTRIHVDVSWWTYREYSDSLLLRDHLTERFEYEVGRQRHR